jgi:hypothetical protein
MTEATDIPVEPLPEFARRFAVSGAQVGWLFGAGTSAAGRIRTAGQLLDEFKAVLYASQNNLSSGEVRMGDPLIGDRVRRYFDNAHGMPPLGDPQEYAVAFELAYPDAAVRRQWLSSWIDAGRPSYGHRVVAALMAAGLVRWVATTNFDDLVERGYEQLRAREESLSSITVASLDSSDRASRVLREDDWPLVIKLHGDIQSDRLKNTDDELREQDGTLRQALLDASRSYGLAVIGYSGRDESVMGTLRAALAENNPFPGGLFWLTSDASAVFAAVTDLLGEARAAGVDARFVESANFDESFGVIARHADFTSPLSEFLSEGRPLPRVRGVVLDTTEGGRFPVLRLNAVPVLELPKVAIHVRCKQQIEDRPSSLIREIGIPGVGVASGRDFYGFGLPNIWQQALARYQPEVVEEVAISVDPDAPDLVIVGLLNEAVIRALCWDRPLRPKLRRRGHHVVVWPDDSDETSQLLAPLVASYENASLVGSYDGRTWREGARVRLDWRFDKVWLVFDPSTFVDPPPRIEGQERPRHSRFAPDGAADFVRERWVPRRNKIWADALGAWAELLVPEETATFSAPHIDNSRLVAATFTIGRQTAFSRPGARASGVGT